MLRHIQPERLVIYLFNFYNKKIRNLFSRICCKAHHQKNVINTFIKKSFMGIIRPQKVNIFTKVRFNPSTIKKMFRFHEGKSI